MEYPIFDVPYLGGSLLIAGISIFHAFIAHFSVGSGFLMAIAQRRALRDGDFEMDRALRKYAFGVLLVPYVLGTVTGVGIWFAIALVSPRAVSILIHQFVWFWAIEWVLFIIEGLAIHLYVFHWGKMNPRAHNRLVWIFALSSVGTLVIINAILSFMLTPGAWKAFDAGALVYKAVLNPGYVPTTLARILISLALAGAAGVVLASLTRSIAREARGKLVRLSCSMILPIILCLPLGAWTFSVMTPRSQTFLMGGAPVMTIFLGVGVAGMLILFLAAAVSRIARNFEAGPLAGVTLCLLAFVVFGAMEFVREGVRKPYVIEGFMYSTGITAADANYCDDAANITRTQREGVLAAAPWAIEHGADPAALTADQYGRAVYRAACLRCHSIDGYNAVRPLVAGWSRETIRDLLDKMDEVKPAMPPFPGTDAEKEALADYLANLDANVPAAPAGGPTVAVRTRSDVPSYDLLGLPAPPWLAQFLKALTLALHWVFLAAAAGAAKGMLMARRGDGLRRTLGELATMFLALAMTFGIAPLLFVQVLYGQFFYSANILMGYVWLGLLAIMILAFYLLHLGRWRAAAGRGAKLPAVLTLALMALAAIILVANATLTQTPQAWREIAKSGGTQVYTADPAFWARWATALAALLAGGGLFLGIFRKIAGRGDESAVGSVRSPLVASVVGMIALAACALWVVQSLPAEIARAVTGSAEAVFAYGALAALGGAIVLAALSAARRSLLLMSLTGAALLVALLGVAAVRDTIRRAALSPGFDLSAVPIHAQWDAFALWAVVFVAGLGLCAYMIILTIRSERQGDPEASHVPGQATAGLERP